MARTRSKVKLEVEVNGKKDGQDITAVEEEVSAIEDNGHKIVKKRKTKTAKPVLEDYLAHHEIPADGKLPDEYVEFHTEEFIEGIQHILKVDLSLYPVIVHDKFVHFEKSKSKPRTARDPDRSKEAMVSDYWYNLIRSVISQQLSGKAAKSIEQKFRSCFTDGVPTPEETLKKSPEELRSYGFSFQKIKYVQNISEHFLDKDSKLSHAEFYEEAPLDEIIEELVKLKGIGYWSAKMFAIFTLKELDVFAHDDLGIARGVSRYLVRRPEQLKKIKEQVDSHEELSKLLKKKSTFAAKGTSRDWVPYHDEYVKYFASQFKPYRLILMMIMWRLAATNIDILENSGIR